MELELRQKLHFMKLKEISVQEHIQLIMEFRALAEIESHLSNEDKVVHQLAGLPESFRVLVTALKASSEVPKMDVVTKRLLHEERKLLSKENGDEQAMMFKGRNGSRKKLRCFRCKKLRHFKRDCHVAEGDLPKGHKAKVFKKMMVLCWLVD